MLFRSPLHWEYKVLATGQPGKSQDILTEEALFSVRSEVDSVASHWDQHSSTLAWKIPWAEEPGRLQSRRSLEVGALFVDWLIWIPLTYYLPREETYLRVGNLSSSFSRGEGPSSFVR